MPNLAARGRRLTMRLPVVVSGRQLDGAVFDESAHSVNVSGGGICFELSRPLGIGAQVALRVELPPPLRKHFGGGATYSARGIVCRVEHLPEQSLYRVGARFAREAAG